MIRPNQVLSKFREGLDTVDIAKHFGIDEYQADELLHEARRSKFVKTFNRDAHLRGAAKGSIPAAVAKRKVSVSLAPLKFLCEGK